MKKILLIVLLGAAAVYAQETRTAADYIQEGNTYLANNDCQFAQVYFQEALKLEEANANASLGKGRALICQGAYPAGIEEFQGIIDRDPNNVAAHVYLAQAYQGQYDSNPSTYGTRLGDAMGIIERAEQLDGDDPELLNVKGVVSFKLNNLEAAREALEQAVAQASSLRPEQQAVIHINLGKTYLDLGQLEPALQAFKRAVSLDPANASAHNNVGAAYFALGNCEDAIYELTQAVNLNARSANAGFNLGRALFDCDQVDGAIPRFEAAVEIPDALNIPALYTYLSRAYVLKGRYDDAVMRARQGALLPPITAEALYYLGQAHEARGNPGDAEDARKAYESALELSPNYQPAVDALQRLGQ